MLHQSNFLFNLVTQPKDTWIARDNPWMHVMQVNTSRYVLCDQQSNITICYLNFSLAWMFLLALKVTNGWECFIVCLYSQNFILEFNSTYSDCQVLETKQLKNFCLHHFQLTQSLNTLNYCKLNKISLNKLFQVK